MGPGNKLNIVDVDDEIARRHDQAYADSETFEDIVRADNQAISEFDSDFVKNWNWHSAIGNLGLRVKRSAGRVFGSIYPKMPPSKGRKRDLYEGRGNHSKRVLTDPQLRWRDN